MVIFKVMYLLFLVIKTTLCDCEPLGDWYQKYGSFIKADYNVKEFLYGYDANLKGLVGDVIGKGGFGTVYMCKIPTYPSKIEIKAVIKVVKYDIITSSEILKEIRYMKEFYDKSPLHFVKFYGCTRTKDRAFIFQEKLDMPLDDFNFLWKFRNEFSLEVKIGLMLMMAQSLKYLDDLGKVHLDIKPNNYMFVERNGIKMIKLIDYGLVNDKGRYTKAGTPGFIDPNMMSSKYSNTIKNDVYALGLTYQIMLYGFEDTRIATNFRMSFQQIKQKSDERKKKLDGMHRRKLRDIREESEQNYFIRINEIIIESQNVDLHQRITPDSIIMTLTDLLKKENSHSIYLNRNYDLSKEYYGFNGPEKTLLELKELPPDNNDIAGIKNNNNQKLINKRENEEALRNYRLDKFKENIVNKEVVKAKYPQRNEYKHKADNNIPPLDKIKHENKRNYFGDFNKLDKKSKKDNQFRVEPNPGKIVISPKEKNHNYMGNKNLNEFPEKHRDIYLRKNINTNEHLNRPREVDHNEKAIQYLKDHNNKPQQAYDYYYNRNEQQNRKHEKDSGKYNNKLEIDHKLYHDDKILNDNRYVAENAKYPIIDFIKSSTGTDDDSNNYFAFMQKISEANRKLYYDIADRFKDMKYNINRVYQPHLNNNHQLEMDLDPFSPL